MISGKWLGLGAMLLSGAAQAGVYFGGAGVLSERENYSDLERASGAKGFIGWRGDASLPLMLELSYMDAGDAEIQDTNGMTLGYTGLQASVGWFGALSATGSGLWVKGGYYSGDSKLEDPNNFLGFGAGASAEESTNGFALGLGGDWKFTPWVGLRFELEGLLGVKDFANDENLTAYSLGLVFEIPTHQAAPAPRQTSYLPPQAPESSPTPVYYPAAPVQQPAYAAPEPAPVITAAPAAEQATAPEAPPAKSLAQGPSAADLPVAAPPTAGALLPGASARTTQSFTLRKLPHSSAEPLQNVVAGVSVQLLGRQINAEGTWWRIESQGQRGWLPQTVLAP